MNSLKINNKVRTNIITKTTSLALATILITSMFVGLIPLVVMPAAAANSYLSVTQTQIGEDNVIEVRVVDAGIATGSFPSVVTDLAGQEVINMTKTPIAGTFVAYIANVTADSRVGGDGGEGGAGYSDRYRVGTDIPAANVPSASSCQGGDLAINSSACTDSGQWPFVQMFTIATADTAVVITYQERTETVTLAHANTKAASVTADRSTAPINATLSITVTDPTENLDPTVADTSALRNYNYSSLALSLNGVAQTVVNGMGNFTETAVNSGIFTLSVGLTTIAEAHGDLISIAVVDDDTGNTASPGSVDVQIRSTDGVISALSSTGTFTTGVTVQLLDDDRNLNSLAKDTPGTTAAISNFTVHLAITVGVTSLVGDLTVAETAISSGNFTGVVSFTHNATGNTPILSGNGTAALGIVVPMGSAASVAATYYDPVSITASHYSETSFSLSRTAASVAFDAASYAPASSVPAVLSVTEPDANLNKLAIEILNLANVTSYKINVTHAGNSLVMGNLSFTSSDGTTTTTLNVSALNGGQMIETGINTGVFELHLDLGTELSGTRTSGDTLTATYRDHVNAATKTGTATIGGTLGTIALDRTTLPLTPALAITVKVTLTDADENSNIAAVDSTTVSLYAKNATNQHVKFNGSASSLSIAVTETGQNTGIFTGTFTYNLLSASTNVTVVTSSRTHWLVNNGSDSIVTGSLMIGGAFNATYSEPMATGDHIDSVGTITPSTASLSVTPSGVNLNGTVVFTLTDNDLNDNILTKDTVSITIKNATNTQAVNSLTLTETAVNSGIFNGSKRAGAQSPIDSPSFNAGDLISASYTDPATATSYYATGFQTSALSGSSLIGSNDASIILDATSYGPYSTVQINVTDADLILAGVSAVQLSLVQTSTDSCRTTDISNPTKTDDTFTWNIVLSPTATAGACTGAIKTALVDTVTAYFVDSKDAAGTAGVIITATATIAAVTGTVATSPSTVLVGDFLTVTVTDMDQNTASNIVESVTAVITTDSWVLGQNVTLPETAVGSGIFEAKVKIVAGIPATTNEVRGATGDAITVTYKDRINATGLVSNVVKTGIIGVSLDPLERVPAGTPAAVDANGNAASPAVGTVSVLQTEVCNDDATSHTFTYIVQVKDANGVVVSINWIQGNTLAAGSCVTPGISWTPDSAGEYTIEIFVWESLSNAVALSPVSSLTVTAV